MSERALDFIDEGIVGFAGLALLLFVVLPLSPFIALGWLFNRALAAGSRGAKTPKAVECEASQSGGDSRNAQTQGDGGSNVSRD